MENGISDLLIIAIPAIVIGLTMLSFMVYRELGPFSGINPGSRWMLIGAFGMGLFAFTLKIGVAIAMTQLPEHTVTPLAHRTVTPASGSLSAADSVWPHNPAPSAGPRYVWETLPAMPPSPADNPLTPEKVALGERLFLETRLSEKNDLSCASCHSLYDKAGGDGRATAVGIDGKTGDRNAPTVWNSGFQSVFFWDGRAPSLEAQAKGPILNPIEMGLSSAREAERRLGADPTYRAAFARAFGDDGPITFERIAQAIAAYERTLVTVDTPYDRFVQGDAAALNERQLRGMALFESVGCVLCHKGPNFSDASLAGGQNPYRFFPANPTDNEKKYDLLLAGGQRGVWRVPTLRNVALTGPWLHNGSVNQLDEVVRIMAGAQLGRSGQTLGWMNDNHALGGVNRAPLNDQEVADLVAFLESLSSDRLAARRGKSPG